MARVTVEDCIKNVPNRFELVALAARRAKQISSGNPITLDRDNDKDSVVSLREIAAKTVNFDELREEMVEGYSRHKAPDVIEGVDLPTSITSRRNRDAAPEVEEEADFLMEELLGEGDLDEGFDEDDGEPADAEMPGDMSFDDEEMDVKD